MTEDQLRQYYNMFTDVWRLFRKYQDISTDEEWQQLIVDGKELIERYQTSFCQKLVMEVFFELERIHK